MADEQRFSVWTILAPLALIGIFVVALFMVRGALEAPPPETSQPATSTISRTMTVDASVPATYSIRKGDTLSAIAERYGLTTDYIMQLNPNLNPMALSLHTKIRLR